MQYDLQKLQTFKVLLKIGCRAYFLQTIRQDSHVKEELVVFTLPAEDRLRSLIAHVQNSLNTGMCVILWIAAGSTLNISFNQLISSGELCLKGQLLSSLQSVSPLPWAGLGTHRRLQSSSPERGVPMGCRVRGGGFLLLVQRDRDEVLSSRGRFGHVRAERRELEPGRLSSSSLATKKTQQDQKKDGQCDSYCLQVTFIIKYVGRNYVCCFLT